MNPLGAGYREGEKKKGKRKKARGSRTPVQFFSHERKKMGLGESNSKPLGGEEEKSNKQISGRREF